MNTYNNSVTVKFITDQNGTAGVLTPITVYLAGTTIKADLFNAANVAIDNPVFTDDSGNYTFNIDNGFYDIIVNEGNLSEVILANQQIAETSDGDDKLNAVIPTYNAAQDGSILTQINIDDSIIPNTSALPSLPAAFWFSQGNNPIVVGASTAIKFTGLSAVPLKQDDGSDLTAGDIPNFHTSYCIKYDSMGQIEYRLQGTSANNAVTSTAAGSIDNNELFPELQNYSVSRDGVTDNWIATGASSNQGGPPDSFTFQSSDWAGLSANTRIQFDSPNLGSLALKNADGSDLDVNSLSDDQAYIAIVNTPFSGAPYFGVQGLSSGSGGGIDYLTWPSFKGVSIFIGDFIPASSTAGYAILNTYFDGVQASSLSVTSTFKILENNNVLKAAGLTGASLSLATPRSDKKTMILITGLTGLTLGSNNQLYTETMTSEILLS